MKTTKQLQEESKEALAKFWTARNNTVITVGQIEIWIDEICASNSFSPLDSHTLIYKLDKKMTEFALEKQE